MLQTNQTQTQTDAVNLPQSYGLHLLEQAKDIAKNLRDRKIQSEVARLDRMVAFFSMWMVYTYLLACLMF